VSFSVVITVFSGNKFVGGGLILDEHSVQNSVFDNTVDSMSLVYLESVSNQVVDDAGQVFLIDCDNMTIKNVNPPHDFRVTIELVGTSNSAITNCRGKVILQNSHNNMIAQNQLTNIGSSINYQSSAIELSLSHSNTIVSNDITAVNSFGIILVGSDYNNVYGNRISSSGSDQAAVKIESTSSADSIFNWVHENIITNSGTGIYLQIARNNAVYGNRLEHCECAIKLSSAYENVILGNDVTDSVNQGIYFFCSDENTLHHNNFINNQKQATEVHEVYWWATMNDSYYSEHNAWDNGEAGNFWSDYRGSDADGDGIGDTPYAVYENYTDRYPLMQPFDISTINAYLPDWVNTSSPPYDSTEELRIIILSPQNIDYNTTEVPLVFTLSAAADWIGYSLDSQEKVAIAGNTTLKGLSIGVHSLTISANNTYGFVSKRVNFYVAEDETQPQGTTLITITVASAASATVVGAGLLFYFKRKR
jgi:parallel beta-helix repeat protein